MTNNPNQYNDDGDLGLSAFLGIILNLIIAGLWVAVFCGVEIQLFTLPLFTVAMLIASGRYFLTSNKLDGACIFFIVAWVANLVASILSVMYCPDARTGIMAALNCIVPFYFFLGRFL